MLLSLTVLALEGCVSIPPESLSLTIDANELSDHVHFLAQPALRGRKPLTQGSRWARRYIGGRFTAYGLTPWGQTESFAQSFGIGTNMIGVLPGSDPNLCDEFILVSAHYDHLGKTEDGLCLGAGDNATGVAALLEIAEHLTMSKSPPRRSICFAAFDQEESGLLGAFAFSQRDDFDPNTVAGIVNIDLLGRNGYNVLDHTLFVAGTHGYASVRKELLDHPSDLQILPVSTHVVGSRGDHAAFEYLDTCTLFFCSGLFADYHQPGDTADKIDYRTTRDSTKVILRAVRLLADPPHPLAKQATPTETQAELGGLRHCLSQLEADPNSLHWGPNEVHALAELIADVDTQIQRAQPLDAAAIQSLFINNYDILARLMNYPEDPYDPNEDPLEAYEQHIVSWQLGLANLFFRPEAMDMGRSLATHFTQHQSRLLTGIPNYEKKETLLHDDHIHLQALPNGEYQLVYIPFRMWLNIKIPGLFKWPPQLKLSSFLASSWHVVKTQGTKADLVNICLLKWHHSKKNDTYESYRLKLLARITDKEITGSMDEYLADHLKQDGWKNETEWLKAIMQSPNPYLVQIAFSTPLKKMNPELIPPLAQILTDPNRHWATRLAVLNKIQKRSPRILVQALVDTLNDPSPLKGPSLRIKLGDEHPLKELADFIITQKSINDKLFKKTGKIKIIRSKRKDPAPKTFGDLALEKLKGITRKDFGQDQEAWQRWIDKRYK